MDTISIFKRNIDIVKYLQQNSSEVYSSPFQKGIQPEIVKIEGCWIRSGLLANDLNLLTHIKKFEVRKDDVFLIGFIRSGNTLVNELVYVIMNNADTTKAKKELLEQRVLHLEFPFPGLENISKKPSPRIIRSHLPFQHMPEQIHTCKVIYVMRNSKDVCVSLYHYMQFFEITDFQGTFEEFYKEFFEGKVSFGPHLDHVCSFWENKGKLENLLFLKYEDLVNDIHGVIKQIAQFLGIQLSIDQFTIIAEHCRFENMKQNKSTNFTHLEKTLIKPSPENGERVGIIRKGIVGDWRNYFTPEMAEAMDKLVEEKWKPVGLSFCDETNTWNF